MQRLPNALVRELKARAQRLNAMMRVGKDGLSAPFLGALDQALTHNELVKVRFEAFKEDKKQLAPELAERTGSHLVIRVGNVVVLYRPRPPGTEPKP